MAHSDTSTDWLFVGGILICVLCTVAMAAMALHFIAGWPL